jgi:hypothetical protein
MPSGSGAFFCDPIKDKYPGETSLEIALVSAVDFVTGPKCDGSNLEVSPTTRVR